MPTSKSAEFEEYARRFLSKEWPAAFEKRTIEFKGAEHSFDLVSKDGKYIGDAKYLTMRSNGKIPHAKLSTISEYVWLLEKTKRKHKFLVFGKDEVPREWLRRFKTLTNVKFYFLSDNKLKDMLKDD